MTGLLSSSSKKPINKWLIGLMLLAMILTVWTAFNDNANEVDDIANDNHCKEVFWKKHPR